MTSGLFDDDDSENYDQSLHPRCREISEPPKNKQYLMNQENQNEKYYQVT